MLEPERASVETEPRAPAAPVEMDGRRPGLNPHVLVIDDDPDIHRLLRVRLEARGYDVTSASSGEEGITRLREVASGSRVPRRGDVGHDRHRRARLRPLAAARRRRDPDHRLQLGAGRDRGAAPRRRRLPAQAVRSRRVPGGARSHARAPAHEPADPRAEPRARDQAATAGRGARARRGGAVRSAPRRAAAARRASRSARAACRHAPSAATSTTGSSCRSAACASPSATSWARACRRRC